MPRESVEAPTRKPRTLGQSKAWKAQPLLNTINGMDRKLFDAHRQRYQSPDDVNAPPLDSDDEDSDVATPGTKGSDDASNSAPSSVKRGIASTPGRRDIDPVGVSPENSSEDEDRPPKRNSIVKTLFGKSGSDVAATRHSGARSRASLTSRPSSNSSAPTRGTKRDASHVDETYNGSSGSRSQSGTKRSTSPLGVKGNGSSHLSNAYGYANTKQHSRGYASKGRPSARQPPKKTEEDKPHEKRDFKAPELLPPNPRAVKQARQPARKFQEPDSLPPASPDRHKTEKVSAKLQFPDSLPETSDEHDNGAKPKRRSFCMPEELPGSLSPDARPSAGAKAADKKQKRQQKHQKQQQPDEKLARIVSGGLKLPETLPGMALLQDLDSPNDKANRNGDEPTSDPEEEPYQSAIENGESPAPDDRLPGATETATCPMCYQPVERALLESFASKNGSTRTGGKAKPSRPPTLTMRQQMRFCDLHKRHSAEALWQTRGYPSPIDWSSLPARCAAHHGLLSRLIAGEDSHYRSQLASKLATGRERTLRKTDRSLSPGYYGGRGLRVMSEHIIKRFSAVLRKAAVDDQVISARSTSFFISTVLVPELATRLVMEDMGVESVEEGRKILEESVEVGDLLNEDVGDVVLPVAAEGGDDEEIKDEEQHGHRW